MIHLKLKSAQDTTGYTAGWTQHLLLCLIPCTVYRKQGIFFRCDLFNDATI